MLSRSAELPLRSTRSRWNCFDLLGCGLGESPIERSAGLELGAVDEQGVRPRQRCAVGVEIAEQLAVAGLQRTFAVAMIAGDVVVNEFRRDRGVADDDEARRRIGFRFLPSVESLLVMAVQRFEGIDELRWQAIRACCAALLRHLLADMLPKLAVDWHLGVRDVVGDGNSRQLDDSAFDRVEQGEIAHRPGEQRAFAIAGAGEEERRRRQVEHAQQLDLASKAFDPRNPQPRRFAVVLGLLALLALESRLFGLGGLLPVAVMRFVIDDDDPFHLEQARANALQHLAFAFRGIGLLRGTAIEEHLAALADWQGLATLECVVVGDDDFGLAEVAEQVRRQQFAGLVVVIRVVRQQDAQAVANRDSRRDDQEAASEARAAGVAHGVDGLPGDQHRHYRGLASSGGEFQRQARQVWAAWVAALVGVFQVLPDALGASALPGSDLGQPDHRFDGLELAEKRPAVSKIMLAPMLQQPRRFPGHLPIAAGQFAPSGDLGAHLVDDRQRVVELAVTSEAAFDFGGQLELPRPAALARLGNRSHQRGLTPAFGNLAGWLPGPVELPVPGRRLVRRVDDRAGKEIVARTHFAGPLPMCRCRWIALGPAARGRASGASAPAWAQL